MNNAEARELLSIYRPGVDDAADPRIAEALRMARTDPELARWLEREQAIDAALSAKLDTAIVPPPGLKADLLALGNVVAPPSSVWQRTWRPALAGAAVAAVVTWLAALALLRPAPPITRPVVVNQDSLENFRTEMVSFVRLTPSLEFESKSVDKLLDCLRGEQSPSEIDVPPGLLAMPAKGCRVLSFRGHNVGLICFLRKNGQLVHLLVVDRSAMASFDGTREHPLVSPEGAWTTAAWTEGNFVYFATVQGDSALLDGYLKGT